MRILVPAALCASLLCGPAVAADVNFSGTLLGLCSVVLTTPGVLALSTDGTSFGSADLGGLPAAVSILAVGDYTISVAAPTRTNAPGTYNGAGETVEVSYSGLAGLSFVNQDYTTAPTSFDIDTLPLSVLVMNNRIVNPNGFAAGTYETRTVVTCS
jgi:hypothetical protein